MLRKLLSFRPSAAMVVASLALFVALGGVGYSATGGNFILGKSNTAGSKTTLTANGARPALRIANFSTGAGATALALSTAAGKPPLTVNSSTKVNGLNVDKLDGMDSADFLGVGDTAADSTLLSGKGVLEFLWADQTAVDSNLLDGLDSSDFLGAGATAADSNLLDGRDSKAYARLSGEVNGDGTVLQGSGFTVTHNDTTTTGIYQVSFPDGTFASNAYPIPMVIPFGLDRIAVITTVNGGNLQGSGSFTTKITDLAGVARNTPFFFMAL